MKKYMLLLYLMLLSSNGFCQRPVEDRYSRWQRERMVYQRWNKFKPLWYYKLFHNKYRKGEDRRNMNQLTPTVLAMDQNAEATAEEKEQVKEVEKFNLAQQANIFAEKHYHLYFKAKFALLKGLFYKLYAECVALQADVDLIQNLYAESSMLDDYLEVVRNGNTDPGDSQEAMEEILHDWERLVVVTSRTARMYRLRNKYKNIGAIKD